MKLPKELTTVTPLSKALALSIFIVFPICGFFLGMNYQQLIDMNNQQQVIIEQNITKPTPTPTPSQYPDGTIGCKTNKDCPLNYHCTQAGPIRYNPDTKKTSQDLTCWKNGDAVPL
jgi:hypothetical protein